MRNAGLDEAQAGIKIARSNINNLRYADDTTLKQIWHAVKELKAKKPVIVSMGDYAASGGYYTSVCETAYPTWRQRA